MAYAVPLGERVPIRRSPLRRLAAGLPTVLGMGLCVGTLLVLLADAVTEDTPRRTTAGAEPATISLPYGGQLERPDPGDLIEPGGLMGLGLLAPGARQRTGLRVRGGARRHAGPLGRRDPPSSAQPPRTRRRPGRAARGRPHRGRAGRGARGLGRPARRGRGREPPGPSERPRPRGPGHDLRPDPGAPPTRARTPACAPTRARAPRGPDGAADAGARTGTHARSPPPWSPSRTRRGAHPGSRRGARDAVPEPVVDDVPAPRAPRRPSPSRGTVATGVRRPPPGAARVPGAGVPHARTRCRGATRGRPSSARTESAPTYRTSPSSIVRVKASNTGPVGGKTCVTSTAARSWRGQEYQSVPSPPAQP